MQYRKGRHAQQHASIRALWEALRDLQAFPRPLPSPSPTALCCILVVQHSSGVGVAVARFLIEFASSLSLGLASFWLASPLVKPCPLTVSYLLGISRDSTHKRRETGGKRVQLRKKRKFELGRQPANTKLAPKRVHTVRVRGGHLKFRALRLDTGNFSWGTEVTARKTRVLDVVYNASNNEMVRTKTLVKGAIVLVDATPYRQWYEAHYGVKIGVKKNAEKVAEEEVKKSDHVLRKLANRQRTRVLDPKLDEQFASGRLLACISSRPGQSGRADGYILEGKELEFYQRKLATKKSKK